MSNRILKSAVLLAFTTLSALAVAADDPPARVGRVALTQGQVSIGGDVGAEMNPAQVNWPVTSGNMLTTAPGARTELRVGSTSIRLDGDSSLEVIELDDDSIRLRLHYGSASVRVVNADVLRGFELLTPQARVRLQQPGRVRVDAERVRDTSMVNVFDGAALVESGGAQLTVRAGKRAEVRDDDMRTASAVQDAFDSWSASRDRLEDKAASSRYVTTEMTGYEDLDRYGSWRTDSEYGPLWIPTVAADWVPYRDGSWTWIEPWGWTWVDNAPWGYAPFHYGRWVVVNRRWAWAPGNRAERLVWAPALVGWVGGADWTITFRDRSRGPGRGWYPLTPHDRYVPTWHASERHVAWLNHHVRPDPHRGRDYRPQGLTVVPQDRFGHGGRVNVPKTPVAAVSPSMVQNGVPVASAPPAPLNRPQRSTLPDRDHDGRPDRFEVRGVDRNGDGRPDSFEPRRADRNNDGRPDRLEARGVDRNGDGRPDRFEARGVDRNGDGRPDRIETRGVDRNGDRDGGPGRPDSFEPRRADRIETARAGQDGFVRQRPAQPQQAPVPASVAAQGVPVTSPPPRTAPPGAQGLPVTSPPPQSASAGIPPAPPVNQGWQRPERQERPERPERQERPDRQERRDWNEARRDNRDGDEHRERRAAPTPPPAAAPAQPAPVMTAPRPAAPQPSAPPPAAAPAPAPVMRAAPPPPPQASAPARPARGEERKRGDDTPRQQER
jgi:hypothetical protein